MYCHQCGVFFHGAGDTCPSCKATAQNPSPKESIWQRIDKKRLGVILCILLLIPIGINIYNNSGTYSFEGNHIVYRGSAKKLVEDDYGMLQSFLETGRVSGRTVWEIRCNDYWISSNSGDLVDVEEYNVTFYEEGLFEYNSNTTGGYYDRFREDFTFEICVFDKFDNEKHCYYFCSSDDVITWLQRNT